MKLKKFFAAFVVSAVLTAGAVAENHPYGMDIVLGIVGVDAFSYDSPGAVNLWGTTLPAKIHNSWKAIEIVPLKINTYICPWLNNHLGIYGSIGFLPAVEFGFKSEALGIAETSDGVGFNVGVEFMAGPAFGVDLGESSVRFQVGVPFHFMFGVGKRAVDLKWENGRIVDYGFDTDVTYTAYGIGLTPQFRFAANKRCSFVLGMDFVFDFVLTREEEYTLGTIGNYPIRVKGNLTAGADNTFRFAWTPYLGLGINFGD